MAHITPSERGDLILMCVLAVILGAAILTGVATWIGWALSFL